MAGLDEPLDPGVSVLPAIDPVGGYGFAADVRAVADVQRVDRSLDGSLLDAVRRERVENAGLGPDVEGIAGGRRAERNRSVERPRPSQRLP